MAITLGEKWRSLRMASKTCGLFLGKFAPLHKGHQSVIETALREVDKLIVLLYDSPEQTKIPLQIRANLIRALYPKVEAIEGWTGPNEVGYTEGVKRKQENYVKSILKNRRITHFYSSEPYGEHMSLALDAVNRTVDLRRKKVNISATAVRKNPFNKRKFLDSLVYRELITKIVFLGAPSSGKTTIAKELAKRFNTEWMPEFGREYWDNNQVNRRLTLKQLSEIAEGHLKREEEKISKSNKFLFIDTNAVTTYLFSLYYHGKSNQKIIKLAENSASKYDLVFVCDIDIPYENTWDRSGEVNREEFHKKTIAYLLERRIPFILLKGSLEERIKKVQEILRAFEKYGNFYGGLVK